MPSQQGEDTKPTTKFTLSFGGVEFCLAQEEDTDGTSAADNNVMSISNLGNGGVIINLNNFVGTLRVQNLNKKNSATTDGSALPATEHVNREDDCIVASPNADEKSEAEVPNPVEDTPSPPSKGCADIIEPVEKPKQQKAKGQQKLNFFGKHGKKQSKKNEVRAFVYYYF